MDKRENIAPHIEIKQESPEPDNPGSLEDEHVPVSESLLKQEQDIVIGSYGSIVGYDRNTDDTMITVTDGYRQGTIKTEDTLDESSCADNIKIEESVPIKTELKDYDEMVTPNKCSLDINTEGDDNSHAEIRQSDSMKSDADMTKVNSDADISETDTKAIVDTHRHPDKKTNKMKKMHVCTVCGKSYSTKAKVTEHMHVHTRPQLSCTECGMLFAQKSQLNQHVLLHTRETLHSCTVCGKSLHSKRSLQRHELCHKREKPYSCKVCGKSFVSTFDLKRHSLLHTGEKPHTCDVCGKSFVQAGILKRHSLLHTGEKPYSCTACGKSFAQKTSLISHEVVHTGEKPYSCTTCGQSFAWKHYLAAHEKLHIREKNICAVCGISFVSKRKLQWHFCGKSLAGKDKVASHEKLQSACGKTFAHEQYLAAHEKLHTAQKSYSCGVCGISFISKQRRERHVCYRNGEKA